jgi:hypothetical protein
MSKIQSVADHLLSGQELTGLQMMLDYRCLAYRDVIYQLRKQGLDIQTEMIGKPKYARYSMDKAAINDYLLRTNCTVKGGKS